MTQTTKQCWSCEATTDYEEGWCTDCYLAMPPTVRDLAEDLHPKVSQIIEPYAGAIRMAIANTLRSQRRPKDKPYQPVFKPAKKQTSISLDDLGI